MVSNGAVNRPPAGWYADAQRDGYQRWFDGRCWTEERRPVATAQMQTPMKRSEWLPTAAAFFTLLLVVCGGALVLAGAALSTVDSLASRSM
ncbi:DUF2510 domain-containing protein [Cellulomonas sp. K42B]|jgi:hypothetical protein